MKTQRRISISLIALLVLAALQTWQSATLVDTGEQVGSTGFDASPQLGLIIALGLLMSFAASYWGKVLRRIASVLTATLTGLLSSSLLPLATAKPQILESKIVAKTGIADWASQQGALTDLNTGTVWIWLAIFSSFALAAWTLRLTFLKHEALKR